MTIHAEIPTASIEYPIPSTLYGISYQKMGAIQVYICSSYMNSSISSLAILSSAACTAVTLLHWYLHVYQSFVGCFVFTWMPLDFCYIVIWMMVLPLQVSFSYSANGK
jgi:hypothetical protein